MVKLFLGKKLFVSVIEQLYKDQLGRHRILVVKTEANEVYDLQVYFEQSCDFQLRYCETVCVKTSHREVAGTMQKIIQNWEKVILIILEIL